VENKPSGNFIRTAVTAVLWVSGVVKAFTIGSENLSSLESVALIGLIHGIAEVVERSTIALIDHVYNQVWERRLVAWGGFRTPRRERLAADIAIMSVVYEPSAVISVNGFLYLYQFYCVYCACAARH